MLARFARGARRRMWPSMSLVGTTRTRPTAARSVAAPRKIFFATTPDRAIFDALIADLDPTSPVTSMVRVSRTMHRDDACRVAIDDVTRR